MVRVRRESTIVMLIDVQERLLPVIDNRDELIRRLPVLLQGATTLGLPFIWTEQYVRGLGPTVPAVAGLISHAAKPVEKQSFSCCGVAGVDGELSRLSPQTVVVAGVETHVCVLQTCLDLLDSGLLPVLVADCTGSRHAHDRDYALQRLSQAGVVLTTVESVLFELLTEAGTDEFRAISRLVKPL